MQWIRQDVTQIFMLNTVLHLVSTAQLLAGPETLISQPAPDWQLVGLLLL